MATGDVEREVPLKDRLPRRLYTEKEVREIAFQAAGAGSGELMKLHPHTEMPSEEIKEATEAVLTNYNKENPSAYDLCELAWGIIANAHSGNWEEGITEWQEAAERWRDQWFRLIYRELRASDRG